MTVLGKREDAKTEFKRAEALEDLKALRPIVAFLNGDGGTVWFGVAEADGVAVRLEPVAELEKKRIALRDRIIDCIEPQPLMTGEQEVRIEQEDGLLVVHVRRGARPPYALRRGDAREYLVRAADRTRALTRDELRERFSAAAGPEDETAQLQSAVDSELGRAAAGLTLAVGLGPTTALGTLESARSRVEAALRGDLRVGNRDNGWNFHSQYSQLTPDRSGWSFAGSPGLSDIAIRKKGILRFHVPLTRLTWPGTVHPNEPGAAERALHPFPLVEFPVSALRLAKWLFEELWHPQPDTTVMAELLLTPIRGWTLAPYSPMTPIHRLLGGWHAYDGLELRTEAHCASFAVFGENPDALAWSLVRDVYEAFGFWDDAIPAEFVRESRRLVMP